MMRRTSHRILPGMSTLIFDAHNHLHDARLAPHLPAVLEELRTLGLGAAVVNGTREADWNAVAALSRAHSRIVPSYGLHPWHAPERSPDWLATLRGFLAGAPGAGLGEIGLDRWIEGHDLPDQQTVFAAQLALASAENRPATIHCIRAWGALWEIIRSDPLPVRGFLLHAYGGPEEMVEGFLERGAYFSFPAYFLHERKGAQREVFRRIPAERLLVETDAPDLLPPEENNPHPLRDAAGKALNHPANLSLAYTALAGLRGVELGTLAALVAENFDRLFR